MTPTAATSAHDLEERLAGLLAERSLAALHGLDANRAYMADLAGEIAACRAAYVGAAVTEIATFRAQLSGPLAG